MFPSGKATDAIAAAPKNLLRDGLSIYVFLCYIINVRFVNIVKTDLILGAIIFQLPIGRRGNYEMNTFAWQFTH